MGRKKVIFIKAFLLAFMLVFFVVPVFGANIFLNSLPQDITVQEGGPIDVPIFFYGGELTGQPVELFVWVEGPVENPINRLFLGPGGWQQFYSYGEMQPAASVSSMLEYANVTWRMIESVPQGTPSFILNICMDPNVDGQLTEGIETPGAICGRRIVNVVPVPAPTCNGLYVYSGSTEVPQISKTVNEGQSASETLAIRDSCGQPVDFNATANRSWITLNQTTGSLTVTMDSSGLTAGQTHSGAITIEANGVTKTIGVYLTVTQSSSGCFPFFCGGTGGGGSGGGSGGGGSGGGGSGGGGSGGGCTPSTLIFSSTDINFDSSFGILSVELASGESHSTTITVKSNCGSVSFTAEESPDVPWLSITNKTSTGFTINIDTTGLDGGDYTAKIRVSSSFDSRNITVNLTVTGPCVDKEAVAVPDSLTRNFTIGQTPSSDIIKIQTNCGQPLPFIVTKVDNGGATAHFEVNPGLEQSGKGQIEVSYPPFDTPASYQGSIEVEVTSAPYPPTNDSYGHLVVPVSVAWNKQQSNVTEIKPEYNGSIYTTYVVFSRQPSPTYFYFIFPVDLEAKYYVQVGMDYWPGGAPGDADMIVRYAGDVCDGVLPTEDVWLQARNGEIKSGDKGYYFNITKDPLEGVYLFKGGCYYIGVFDISGDSQLKINVSFVPRRN